jgi:CRISPR type I-E-associated protein CasB/Cse2
MQAAGWRRFPGDKRDADASPDESPRLGEVRFRRLTEVGRGEEQVTAFVRLIALLEERVNVAELAADFWYWNDRTKRRWAFDYYHASVATPTDPVDSFSEGMA